MFYFHLSADNTRSNHFINGDEEIESRKNLSDSTNQNICHGSIKSDLQAAAKEFFNNSIEVANQLVENSKLVDGFLLSECASVKPYMAAYSGSGKVPKLKIILTSLANINGCILCKYVFEFSFLYFRM